LKNKFLKTNKTINNEQDTTFANKIRIEKDLHSLENELSNLKSDIFSSVSLRDSMSDYLRKNETLVKEINDLINEKEKKEDELMLTDESKVSIENKIQEMIHSLEEKKIELSKISGELETVEESIVKVLESQESTAKKLNEIITSHKTAINDRSDYVLQLAEIQKEIELLRFNELENHLNSSLN